MIVPSLSPTARFLVTTFGLGFLRPAPGTWGSLPPVALAAILLAGGVGPSAVFNLSLLTVCVVFSLACVFGGEAAEIDFQREDPSNVVADETAGMCLPLMFLPAAALSGGTPLLGALTTSGLYFIVFAFLAFRALDILKPWPCEQLQRVPGGWGILLDDLAAGVLAALVMQLLTRAIL
jgi:phosphatidylglycerophosphatase A